MSFNISDWPFQASANTLALGFSCGPLLTVSPFLPHTA